MGFFSSLFGGGKTGTGAPGGVLRNSWQQSPTQLLLLKSFRHGGKAEFLRSEQWDPILPSGLQATLERFIADGLLVNATLAQTAHTIINAAKAKELARSRGLKVSGNRSVVIDRLLDADPEGMGALLAHERVMICAPHTVAAIEGFVNQGRQVKDDMEAEVFSMLKEHNFKEAVQKVCHFESKQVFGRGVAMDWSTAQPVLLQKVEAIFRVHPKILKDLGASEREPLCVAAAMMELLGTGTATKWLPPGLKGVDRFDLDTAARMQKFRASHNLFVVEPGVKYKILSTEDSCEACKRIAGRTMFAKDIPELPFEHCTHEYGCRCEVVRES